MDSRIGTVSFTIVSKLASGVDADPNEVSGLAAEVGTRLRLFLLDMPEGSATAILAIAVIAPEASFETVVNETVPILDSTKFRLGGT